MLDSLTPDVWNRLILITAAIGGVLALWRLLADLSRPTLSDDDARRDAGGPDSEKRA